MPLNLGRMNRLSTDSREWLEAAGSGFYSSLISIEIP